MNYYTLRDREIYNRNNDKLFYVCQTITYTITIYPSRRFLDLKGTIIPREMLDDTSGLGFCFS